MKKTGKRKVVVRSMTDKPKTNKSRKPKQLHIIHADVEPPKPKAVPKPTENTEHSTLVEGLIRENTNIISEVVTITPEVAESLLDRNMGNRPLQRRPMNTYARDIEHGNWKVTGEPIILDEKGNLLDGQNRLNACLISGKPFTTLLVSGVLRSQAFLAMGSGEKRRAAHALAIAGEQNTKVLQAALKLLWTWDRGELARSKYYPSNAELQDTLEHYPGIRPFVSTTFAKSVKGAPGSVVAAMRFLFGQSDEPKAEQFFEQLSKGTGLTEDSPVRLLRERLINSAASHDKIPQFEMCALFVKAWNAFLSGEKIQVLKFRSAGKAAEDMPQIANLVAPEHVMTAH